MPRAGAATPTPGRGPEAQLSSVERHIAAQAAALQQVPLNMPLPNSVIALLASTPGALGSLRSPSAPAQMPRVAEILDQVQAMIDDLSLRQRELAGRIATLRAARRAGPAAHLLDCSS